MIRRQGFSPPRTTILSASPTTAIPSSTSRWSTARRSISAPTTIRARASGASPSASSANADGGKKLALDDMQSIQADAVTEWAQALAPTFVDAAKALAEEIATPGTHADLTASLVRGEPDREGRARRRRWRWCTAWSASTRRRASPRTADRARRSPTRRRRSSCDVWIRQFADRAFGDEIRAARRRRPTRSRS